MQLDRKGPGPKGGSYLVCAAARRGMGCITNGWRYLDFERSFLALVEKINLPSLIRNDDPAPKQLDDEIQSLMGRKAAIEEEMEKAYALLAMRSDLKFVADKLSSLQEQLFQMERHIAEKSAERQTLVAEALALSTSKTEIRSLIETMQTPAEEGFDLYRLRAQVADRIRSLISSLTVAPVGIEPRTERAIAQYQQKTGDTGLADMLRSDIQRARYFAVGFKNGDVLTVYPNPKDPLQFKFKIVGSDSGMDVVLAS